jgi:hypothetical protein
MKQRQVLQQRCAQPPDSRALLLACTAGRRAGGPGHKAARLITAGARAAAASRRAGMGGARLVPWTRPAAEVGAGAARLERVGGLALDGRRLLLPHACKRDGPGSAPCGACGLHWSGRARDIHTTHEQPAAALRCRITTILAQQRSPAHRTAPGTRERGRPARAQPWDDGARSGRPGARPGLRLAAEQLEAARALEQLADSPVGGQRIQRAGGVPALLRLLQGGEQSEELQLAAASALEHMAAGGRRGEGHLQSRSWTCRGAEPPRQPLPRVYAPAASPAGLAF